MVPPPDIFSINGTNGIANGTNTNITPTTITTTTFHKHQKWLIDKKQYIIHVILFVALLLILLGIFMGFGRHNKSIPARILELGKFRNGSNDYFSISPLQQTESNEQSSDNVSFDSCHEEFFLNFLKSKNCILNSQKNFIILIF